MRQRSSTCANCEFKFHAQELDDGQPGQQIDGDFVFGFGAIERADVQFGQQGLEVGGLALLARL